MLMGSSARPLNGHVNGMVGTAWQWRKSGGRVIAYPVRTARQIEHMRPQAFGPAVYADHKGHPPTVLFWLRCACNAALQYFVHALHICDNR